MKYLGKLYGKVSGKFIPLEGTGEEIDQMETALKTTRRQLEIAVEAFEKITGKTRCPIDGMGLVMTASDAVDMINISSNALDEINKVGGA